MNAPCIIMADFEANHKNTNESFGGAMKKLAEQKATSFSYKVHWIDTGETWGPYIY